MKSMVVLSVLVASAVSQFVPITYAPSFAYGIYGARTAHDVFQPTGNTPAIFYSNPGYAYRSSFLTAAATPLAAPVVASVAAPTAAVAEPVVASPAAVVTTKSNVQVQEEETEGPLAIRAIFPVFTTDLRAGVESDEVIFLRPEQVAPIQPVSEIDLTDDAEEIAAENPGVIVPDFSFRSAPKQVITPDLSFRSAPLYHPYFNLPYAALPYPSLLQTVKKD